MEKDGIEAGVSYMLSFVGEREKTIDDFLEKYSVSSSLKQEILTEREQKSAGAWRKQKQLSLF